MNGVVYELGVATGFAGGSESATGLHQPSLGMSSRPSRHGNTPAAKVRRYLDARRLRERLLPDDLFADPAWDVLLDLFASELEGQQVCVSSACVAAMSPPSTALRWIHKLVGCGAVLRTPDPADARRSYLRLHASTRHALETWVEHGLGRVAGG